MEVLIVCPSPLRSLAGLVFNNLISDNSNKLQSLFDKVAEDNPVKAIELFMNMSEFVLLKLRSTKLKQDADLINNLKIQVIDTRIPLASSKREIME